MRRKLTYESVRMEFERRGCVLISETYVRSKDKLRYICKCGNEAEIAFDKFSQGQYCRNCRGERSNERNRHTHDFIKKEFEKGGCRLLTTYYINNKQKLRYVCECGNEAEICYSKFNAGQRCQKCRAQKISEKLSGPNASNWDHSRSMEQRIKDRRYPEYYEWRRQVFDRDDYTCWTCGERGGKLVAHHIQGFAKYPELRTEVDNGATLCEACHKEYHKKVEHNTATTVGWDHFLNDYREPPFAGEIDETDRFEWEASQCGY